MTKLVLRLIAGSFFIGLVAIVPADARGVCSTGEYNSCAASCSTASGHCWHALERLMDANKIARHGMKRDGRTHFVSRSISNPSRGVR